MLHSRKVTACFGVTACLLTIAACGSSSSSGSGSGSGSGNGTITIGASLSQTGPLAQFAPLITAGYQQAIAQVNAQGGLPVGATKRKVKLVLLDNQSNANTAAQQVRTLVTQNGVTALLGAATPPINVPEASAAEAERVPFVTSLMPIGPWIAASKSWHYAWALFFNPPDAVQAELKTAELAKTDKKIALFTDNEADGVAWAQLVGQMAPAAGYKVVTHATFPVGTSDYRSYVEHAASAGADIVIAQMVPPDGLALWKQMKSLGYHPKFAFCEKCANAAAFPQALGPIANGTSVTTFWSSAENLPGTAQATATLGKKFTDDPDLGEAVAAETAAQVLFDAIARAGSTDPAKIDAAIAQTDKTYTFAHIKFATDNAAVTPSLMTQWQNGSAVQVYPTTRDGKVQVPAAGLQ